MRISRVKLHNFRSVSDAEFNLYDYALLVGANNAGKSNIIDALRVFYSDLKYSPNSDFPRFATEDDPAWIELEYVLTDAEFATLPAQYQQPGNRFRVRKALQTAKPFKKDVIYGYSGDTLEEKPFLGKQRGQLAHLGKVIYIPPVSHLKDQIKLSGPSPLRDLLYLVVDELVDSSAALQHLTEQFVTFSEAFKSEQTSDNHSIAQMETEINREIADWDMEFSLVINPVTKTDLVKNLISLEIIDKTLETGLEPSQFGDGFQRHLIFTLIQMAARYQNSASAPAQNDFLPNFTLILFEEPEAFLHPIQQGVLYENLSEISEDDNFQVLITTHSPNFVSFNVDHIPSIVRLSRRNGQTEVGQLSPAKMRRILEDNQQINSLLAGKYDDAPEDLSLEMEAVRYFLWLGADRCGMFFAERVLLVEGPTERILIEYLIRAGEIQTPKGGLFVLDCMSKFNIHRFMNLLETLHIPHDVLFDEDGNTRFHHQINQLIRQNKNAYTHGIDSFPVFLENYLDIKAEGRTATSKPEHLMLALLENRIPPDRVKELINKLNRLINE